MKRITVFFVFVLSMPLFALRADFNGDHVVNLLDLAILAEEWLMSNLGPEIVSNHNFELGDNGDWNKIGPVGIADDVATFTGTSWEQLNQFLDVEYLEHYRLKITIDSISVGYVNANLGTHGIEGCNAPGTYEDDISVTGTGSVIINSYNSDAVISEVSVKKILPDAAGHARRLLLQ